MWETRCGPRHPEWDASPETEAKSCGPGMQPFERSKNPIQVNLFGEKHPNHFPYFSIDSPNWTCFSDLPNKPRKVAEAKPRVAGALRVGRGGAALRGATLAPRDRGGAWRVPS